MGNVRKHTNHIWKGIDGTSMQKRRTECNMEIMSGGEGADGAPIMSLHSDGQRSELELCIVDSRSDANEDKHRRFDGL